MKKSLIALAVAGALTAPMVAQADATLYGSLRLMAVAEDGKSLDVADNASRVGIKGSVDTNIDGVKAIYRGEWKINGSGANEANFGEGRLAYVGLTGGFGTAAIGQQWTPEYSFVTGAVDILDGTSTAVTVDVFRASNVISYVTPAMGGFQAALAVVANDNSVTGAAAVPNTSFTVNAVADDEDADSYHVAAKYSVAGFTAAASFIGVETAQDMDRTAVSVAYAADALYVAALYQNHEDSVANDDDDSYELAGSYAFGDTKVLANIADMGNDAQIYGLEVQQTLGKQARLFANYKEANDDAELAGNGDTFSAGMRVDF
ncbi:porin [Neptunomonas antarctica]|uniref:Outer membrane protein (Porin) n=1 Tax=Neptunomonas antarctica TaxID=619304 RepID=A0A1N7NQ43_9GAMM|nr:porin [Neptunomonas antarctica]SIT00358.1 Outer membrane protein (porin) [Neptunomonas antarctica]